MLRLPLIVLTLALLAGCQSPRLLPSSGQPDAGAEDSSCHFDKGQLNDWIKYEHRFISSTISDKRALLVDAEQRQKTALYALLLSSPGQSQTQLERAQQMLTELPLSLLEHCRADQYLANHQRRLALQLEALQQIETLQLQKMELERQVDALTDLERQITRQREEH